MTVFAPALSSIWRQIEDAGLAPEPLFNRHGVEKDVIFDPNARVPAALVDRISFEANELISDPFFGLREAEYFRPAHLGPLGFAWLASSTLEEALSRLARYSRVINDHLSIELLDSRDHLEVRIFNDETSMDPYHRDTGSLSVLVRMCRFLCGDKWNPVKVSTIHNEPVETAYYYSCFRCPVEFASEHNSIEVDRQQARERITGADETLAQLNDHIVLRYVAHRSKEDLVNRTRVAILDRLSDGKATEIVVADALALSPRQLSRKLKAENTSFRALLLECRQELAERYIRDSTLSLTEISYLLGFSETSSFSRAFRRWTGKSPTEVRESTVPDPGN